MSSHMNFKSTRARIFLSTDTTSERFFPSMYKEMTFKVPPGDKAFAAVGILADKWALASLELLRGV